MRKKYFIRGTITIRVDESKWHIGITPCIEFLTPDKPYKAIAYPNPLENTTAKLIELANEKSVECDANEIEKYLPALLSISAQQKPIELHLIQTKEETKEEAPSITEPKESSWKIVGFVYPVP